MWNLVLEKHWTKALSQESPDLDNKFCNYPNYVDLISCYSSFLSPKVVMSYAGS